MTKYVMNVCLACLTCHDLPLEVPIYIHMMGKYKKCECPHHSLPRVVVSVVEQPVVVPVALQVAP
jgi:hypothetical protein